MKRTLSRALVALTLLFGVLPAVTVLAAPVPIELAAAPVMLAAVTQADTPAMDAPTAPDPGAWFASTAALAVVIAAIVAFLKAHLLTSLDGLGTVLASLVVGVLLGLLGHALGYLTDGLVPAIGFGGSAGLLASGGWDALKGLLGKRQAAT